MNILKETSRKVVKMENYRGVCDGCQSPLEYDGELIVVEIGVMEDRVVVVPIDILACPNCNKTLATMTIYRSMDISKELAKLG